MSRSIDSFALCGSNRHEKFNEFRLISVLIFFFITSECLSIFWYAYASPSIIFRISISIYYVMKLKKKSYFAREFIIYCSVNYLYISNIYMILSFDIN